MTSETESARLFDPLETTAGDTPEQVQDHIREYLNSVRRVSQRGSQELELLAARITSTLATLPGADPDGTARWITEPLRQAVEVYDAAARLAALTWHRVNEDPTGAHDASALLAARYYEAQAKQYGQVADTVASTGNLAGTDVLTGDDTVPASTVRTATMLPAAPDPLKVAARFILAPGEQFACSAATKSNDDGYAVLAAAVDTENGRVVHVGVPVLDEEKRYWKGAHAPGNDSEVDEEGISYSVDTNADRTVILDATDVTHLPEQVEQVITQAIAVDKQYRQLVKESDRLYTERLHLETKKYGDGADADRQMRLDASEDSHRKYQRDRRDYVAASVDRLGADDRARYDALQARIDEAGSDLFEADREQQAAEVCGLSVDEYRELVELQKKSYPSRTHAENQRVDELHLTRGLPPLLAEQAAIVYGLSVDEYRELEALDEIGPPHMTFGGRRPGGRTPRQEARYEQLRTAPGGVTGATAKQTVKLRDRLSTYQKAHHSDKITWAAERQQRAELQTRARPLAEADARRLQQVITAHDELDERLQALGGETSARVEIPGSNGMTLVVEAVQREEEGGVDYELGCRPSTTDDEPPTADAYRTTPGGLRKVAKMLAALGGGTPSR